MKYILLLKISAIFAYHLEDAPINREGIDAIDMTEEEFLENFGLPDIDDPEEKEKRREALKQHQDEVKKFHEKFINGEIDWDAAIYEFSDLPDDEFVATHTGLMGNMTSDPESERFFNQVRLSRSTVPASYSSVAKNYVTPVRNQGNCGSCVAFATAVLVETCFKKAIGKFGDYSEQHMVDCAYDGDSVNGCGGAAPMGYAKWLKEKKPKLASETGYPYKAKRGTCSTSYTEFNQGAKVSGAYWTESGDEATLKKLVAQHGAVVVGVQARGAFSEYKSGIFSGCTGVSTPDHAVAVVGYGTEKGVDYWLIKNSWGTSWGEKGFIRMKRGVKMCGIGATQVTVSCAKDGTATTSATSATTTTTTTTAKATTTTASSTTNKCKDFLSFCSEDAKMGACQNSFFKSICPKTCKACSSWSCKDMEGMFCDKSWCGVDEMFDAYCQKTCKKC